MRPGRASGVCHSQKFSRARENGGTVAYKILYVGHYPWQIQGGIFPLLAEASVIVSRKDGGLLKRKGAGYHNCLKCWAEMQMEERVVLVLWYYMVRSSILQDYVVCLERGTSPLL